MIYFLRAGDIGPVKIGYTSNFEPRLYRLQRQYRIALMPIRIIAEGRRWTEIWLHRAFLANRIRGEWFHYEDRMMTIVPPDKVPGFANDYVPIPNVSNPHKGYSVADEIYDMITALNGRTDR